MSKRTETEVAQTVMEWMLDQRWDCYPEAELGSGRADIVGVRPFPFMPHRKCVHIVECKTSWTISLLEQAFDRMAYAHYVSIAAPTVPARMYEWICKRYGIGMIRFNKNGSINEYNPSIYGRLMRHKHSSYPSGPDRVLSRLHQDMKRYSPGSTSASGYSTPWRRTMDRCVEFVRDNPGCTVKEIVEKVEYHYASKSGARQGILLWLSQREGIKTVKEGNAIHFYPV